MRTIATLSLIATLAASPVHARGVLDGCPADVTTLFGERAPQACAIAWCETGGTYDNSLIGKAGEVSIFQIHPVHFGDYSRQRLRDDVEYASEVAYEMSNGGRDWRDWACA